MLRFFFLARSHIFTVFIFGKYSEHTAASGAYPPHKQITLFVRFYSWYPTNTGIEFLMSPWLSRGSANSFNAVYAKGSEDTHGPKLKYSGGCASEPSLRMRT